MYVLSNSIEVLTHPTRPFPPSLLSVVLIPVISSTRTTPKEYTSVLFDTLPYAAYSGAQYARFPGHSIEHENSSLAILAKPKSPSWEEYKNNLVFSLRLIDSVKNHYDVNAYQLNPLFIF